MWDRLTFETTKRRDGRWTTRCPQLAQISATHADRHEAISRCIHAAFQRAAEIDEQRAAR